MKLISPTDEILHTETKPFERDEIPALREFAEEMLVFMKEQDGIGLASPQVGKSYRLFVTAFGDQMVFNPEIVQASEHTKRYDEGCLSYPMLFLKVERPLWVDVKYLTLDDENHVIEKEERLQGIHCQCFCHELDHLNGITFDQKVGSFALKKAKEKKAKLLRKTKRNSI